jgi:hypothetical protein
MVQKPGTPQPDGSDQERDGPGNSGRDTHVLPVLQRQAAERMDELLADKLS